MLTKRTIKFLIFDFDWHRFATLRVRLSLYAFSSPSSYPSQKWPILIFSTALSVSTLARPIRTSIFTLTLHSWSHLVKLRGCMAK